MQNQTTRPEDELGREPDEGAPNACNDSEFAGLDQLTADARVNQYNDSRHGAVQVDASVDVLAAAVKAIEPKNRSWRCFACLVFACLRLWVALAWDEAWR